MTNPDKKHEYTFTYLHEAGYYNTNQVIRADSFEEAYAEFKRRQPQSDVIEVTSKQI